VGVIPLHLVSEIYHHKIVSLSYANLLEKGGSRFIGNVDAGVRLHDKIIQIITHGYCITEFSVGSSKCFDS
jgi:hypothetical protein